MDQNKTSGSVDPSKYDQAYFARISKGIDFSKPLDLEAFGGIHTQMADLISLGPEDVAVDFGCGSGHLSFALHVRTGCRVVGIDYSEEAIVLCKKNLDLYRTHSHDQGNLQFVCAGLKDLPDLRDVSAVYFSDVVEHMKDEEIVQIMDKVKTWSQNHSLRIVVHTDNDLFLRWVRPALDLLGWVTRTHRWEDIRKRNQWERERHINLMTPMALKKKMLAWGFVEVSRTHGSASPSLVRSQLGPLQRIPGLATACMAGVKRLAFLSPSFYAVYRLET